jgi:hypothetical protein
MSVCFPTIHLTMNTDLVSEIYFEHWTMHEIKNLSHSQCDILSSEPHTI